MSESKLPDWMGGRGGWERIQKGWYAADKHGTIITCRTHPQGFHEFLIEFKEGDKRNQEILFRGSDLRLLKEILNQIPEMDLI